MANYIAIFEDIIEFYSDFKKEFESFNILVYLVKFEKNSSQCVKVDSLEDLKIDYENNFVVYLSDVLISPLSREAFHTQPNSSHIVDARGGRSNKDYIEQIKMQILSKSPNKTIKLFFNALQKKLKENYEYGVGVEPDGNRIYSKQTYYKKTAIKDKVMWFDYKLKIGPTHPIESN